MNTISLNKDELIKVTENQSKDWVLNGLRRGSVAFLIAPPDSGKGYTCLSIAYELATQVNLLGVRYAHAPRTKTLYWPVEDGVENTADRILSHFNDISEEFQKICEDNIKLYNSTDPIACSNKTRSLEIISQVNHAKKNLIEEATKYDVLIIDTIREAMGSADEVADDHIINVTLKEIAKKANVSIIAVHHPTKNVARGVESVSSVSGSGLSYTIANSRLHMYIECITKKDKTIHKLRHIKANFLNNKERLNCPMLWSENDLPYIHSNMLNKLKFSHSDNELISTITKTPSDAKKPIIKNLTVNFERKEPKVINTEMKVLSQESISKGKAQAESEQVITSDLVAQLKKHRDSKKKN
jgi:RecA-family ATPase